MLRKLYLNLVELKVILAANKLLPVPLVISEPSGIERILLNHPGRPQKRLYLNLVELKVGKAK